MKDQKYHKRKQQLLPSFHQALHAVKENGQINPGFLVIIEMHPVHHPAGKCHDQRSRDPGFFASDDPAQPEIAE